MTTKQKAKKESLLSSVFQFSFWVSLFFLFFYFLSQADIMVYIHLSILTSISVSRELLSTQLFSRIYVVE